jgi:hypothetical protein
MSHIARNPTRAYVALGRGPGSRKGRALRCFAPIQRFLVFLSYPNLLGFPHQVEDSEQEGLLDNMAPVGGSGGMEAAALARRKALNSPAGPMALMRNLKVFGIACFACLGGLLYGYNQGVFSGVLVMTSFKQRKLDLLLILLEQRC